MHYTNSGEGHQLVIAVCQKWWPVLLGNLTHVYHCTIDCHEPIFILLLLPYCSTVTKYIECQSGWSPGSFTLEQIVLQQCTWSSCSTKEQLFLKQKVPTQLPKIEFNFGLLQDHVSMHTQHSCKYQVQPGNILFLILKMPENLCVQCGINKTQP